MEISHTKTRPFCIFILYCVLSLSDLDLHIGGTKGLVAPEASVTMRYEPADVVVGRLRVAVQYPEVDSAISATWKGRRAMPAAYDWRMSHTHDPLSSAGWWEVERG